MTKRQAECLAFLRRWFATHDYAPSMREISAGIGQRSKSGPFRLLNALEREGYLARSKGCARTLRLVERPELGALVDRLLDSVSFEEPERDRAVVSAAALGDLDVYLAEVRDALDRAA